MLSTYGKFVNTKNNKIEWNDNVTSVDRKALQKLIAQSPELKAEGEKYQKANGKILA